jgi:hypothetical protein
MVETEELMNRLAGMPINELIDLRTAYEEKAELVRVITRQRMKQEDERAPRDKKAESR